MGLRGNISLFTKMSFETTRMFLTDAILDGDRGDLGTPSGRLALGRLVKGWHRRLRRANPIADGRVCDDSTLVAKAQLIGVYLPLAVFTVLAIFCPHEFLHQTDRAGDVVNAGCPLAPPAPLRRSPPPSPRRRKWAGRGK